MGEANFYYFTCLKYFAFPLSLRKTEIQTKMFGFYFVYIISILTWKGHGINVESICDTVGGPPITTPLKNVRWRVSNWSLDPNDKSLELNGNTVLVKDAGKYSVYGQVTFFSIVNQDLFHVHVNDQPWITCTASQTVSIASCTKLTGTRRSACITA